MDAKANEISLGLTTCYSIDLVAAAAFLRAQQDNGELDNVRIHIANVVDRHNELVSTLANVKTDLETSGDNKHYVIIARNDHFRFYEITKSGANFQIYHHNPTGNPVQMTHSCELKQEVKKAFGNNLEFSDYNAELSGNIAQAQQPTSTSVTNNELVDCGPLVAEAIVQRIKGKETANLPRITKGSEAARAMRFKQAELLQQADSFSHKAISSLALSEYNISIGAELKPRQVAKNVSSENSLLESYSQDTNVAEINKLANQILDSNDFSEDDKVKHLKTLLEQHHPDKGSFNLAKTQRVFATVFAKAPQTGRGTGSAADSTGSSA